jgi:hypothetical protein
MNKIIQSNTTSAQNSISAFASPTSSGFTLGADAAGYYANANAVTYASWTFREQPKFFDIVTYTGTNGVRTINHNLGSAAGCIMIKCTSTTSNWMVWHRSISGQDNLYLNATDGTSTVAADPISVDGWPSSTSTTTFTVDSGTDSCNTLGETYVAYLFAHDAGGFGLTGSDNVISCGTYTGNGSATGPVVTLGYEPQWVMIKNTSAVGNWAMQDVMRGMPVGGSTLTLFANLSNAEANAGASRVAPIATGFQITNTASGDLNGNGNDYIYIAIRRGPMKMPTVGTSVFSPQTWTGSTGQVNIPTNFPVDLGISGRAIPGTGHYSYAQNRLAGVGASLRTNTTDAEVGPGIIYGFYMDSNTTAYMPGGNASSWNETDGGGVGYAQSGWFFRRAPSFFDEVCYTGTGVATAYNHNLGVIPELVIVKSRSTTYDWYVIQQPAGGGTGPEVLLNTTGASLGSVNWSSLATASTFTPYSFFGTPTGASGQTYVAYLFATCAGVSKVGSYSGSTGNTVVVPCGFTSGVRFVLIKRTDSTGDWYVWDSARGIIAGNDPYLLLNNTAAEVTSTDYIDTYSAGFEVTSTAPTGLNATGGTYIFLAIA